MSEADGIVGLYERRAHDWDRDRGRDLFEAPWLDRFIGQLDGSDVLDLGCGSGEPIAGYLIGKGMAVTGVDSAPTLIGICRDRFPDESWIAADMRTLELGRVFSGILAWHSMIHLTPDDQTALFPVLRRHARPGTVLMFTSGYGHGEVIGQWHGEPLYHGSLDIAEYRSVLDQNGFGVVQMWLNDPACGHATVWLARAR